MPSELRVNAVHQGAMKVTAHAGPHEVTMDYPPGPQAAGFSPLEMLLASLAACSANSLAALLRRTEQPVRGIEVNVRGTRRDEHPTVITDIELEFVVRGKGVDRVAVDRAVALSEEKICPVWAMLRPQTAIKATVKIEE